MKNFSFPRSRIILPAFRTSLARVPEAVVDGQNEADESHWQDLLEDSLLNGRVIYLAISSPNQPAAATGIVRTIDPAGRTITVETLEGPRVVQAGEILSIREA
jgi:hypothetical protein